MFERLRVARPARPVVSRASSRKPRQRHVGRDVAAPRATASSSQMRALSG